MESIEFNFTFEDILSRRGDFTRDIRSVCNGNGQIYECKRIISDHENIVIARLWMSGASGSRHTTLTVAVLFDPSYYADIVFIPDFKLSFYYQWNDADFNTEALMSIMDNICGFKLSDSNLHEWNFISAAAAVSAVYEYAGRLEFGGNGPGLLHECIIDPVGLAYTNMHEFFDKTD